MLQRAIFWLLLPVTAVQGLWLRRRATRLPGAEGERTGSCGSGPELYLLAIGDSIIDGVGMGEVERSLPVRVATELAERRACRVSWRVEGTSGHDIADVLLRLDGLPADVSADLVLISVGVNDVTGLTFTRRWRRDLQRLLRGIRARWPEATILFAGLPPMGRFPLPPQPLSFSLGLRAGILDRIARELIADCPGALHVPTRIDPQVHEFCPDGFHPSAESCTLWARELVALLAEAAGARSDRQSAGKPEYRQ
jgi:lysophospholipase L1-like esterase